MFDLNRVKTTDLEMTEAIAQYLLKRVSTSEGLANSLPLPQSLALEIGRTTKHHKKGNIFRFEANLSLPQHLLRAEYESADLYKSIDLGLKDLERQMRDLKEKYLDQKKTIIDESE